MGKVRGTSRSIPWPSSTEQSPFDAGAKESTRSDKGDGNAKTEGRFSPRGVRGGRRRAESERVWTLHPEGRGGRGRKEGGPRPLTTHGPGQAGQVKRPSSGGDERTLPGPHPDTRPLSRRVLPTRALPLRPGKGAHAPETLTRSWSPPRRASRTPREPQVRGGGEGGADEGRSPTRYSRAAAAAAIPSLRSSARPHGRTSP